MKRPAGPQASEEMLIVRLREKGYRVTPQRREIIHLLSGDTSDPSAPDVLKRARKRVPRISISTVYYTLDMLKREGLIGELEFYDRNLDNTSIAVNLTVTVTAFTLTAGNP